MIIQVNCSFFQLYAHRFVLQCLGITHPLDGVSKIIRIGSKRFIYFIKVKKLKFKKWMLVFPIRLFQLNTFMQTVLFCTPINLRLPVLKKNWICRFVAHLCVVEHEIPVNTHAARFWQPGFIDFVVFFPKKFLKKIFKKIGVFFKYEVAPYSVRREEKPKRFLTFLTSMVRFFEWKKKLHPTKLCSVLLSAVRLLLVVL